MDDDMLLLIAKANIAACGAMRAGRLADAERWSRVAQRYVDIIMKLKRWRAETAKAARQR
jgi:hypothetical protein